MTIRLLCAYAKYPVNAIVTLDAGTENGLVNAKMASTDTTGGNVYIEPPAPSRSVAANLVYDYVNSLLGLASIDGSILPLGGGSALTRPGAPVIGVSIAGNGSVTINWSTGSNGGLPIQYFVVTLSNGRQLLAAAGSTSITFYGLPNGAPVTGVVYAVNGAGPGDKSAASEAVTPVAASKPNAPILGDISAGDGVVVVPLSSGGDGGAPITSYSGTLSNGMTATALAGATEIRFTGVPNNAVVTASVKANNGVGASVAATSDPARPAAGLVTNELTRLMMSYPAYANANSVYQPLGSMNTNYPEANGGGPGTCMLIAELQADASHIQLIVANPPNNTQARTIVGATVVCPATLTDKLLDSLFTTEAVDITFGGNVGVTIPAVTTAGQTSANIGVSDWIPITTKARTDVVGAPPIVAFRECAMYPTYANGAYGAPYFTLTGAQWGTDRGAMFAVARSGNTLRSAHGASAAVGAQCTILGFRYRLKSGNGMCVAWFGSSITNSDISGLVKRPFSYGNRSAALNSSNAMPIEYINGGQSGQTQDKAAKCAEDFIPVLKPTHTVIEFCNVNNISTANSASFDTLRTANTRIITAANASSSRVCIYNTYTRNVAASPTDTSYYDAAGDALRLAFHAEYKALGYPLLNTNSYMSDGNSPSALPMVSKGAAGNYTTIGDGVHHAAYSDTNVLIPRATAFVGRLRDRYFGV